MTRYAWAAVIAAVVLIAAGYALSAVPASQRAAADAATLAGYRHSVAALEAQAGRLDTLYVRQMDTLKVMRTRWDTVRLATHTTDTLVSVDTLRLVVAVADSTINACTAALTTCDQRTAVLRSILAVDSGAIRALSRDLARAKMRGRLACVAGGAATAKGFGLGGACGLRLF